ncbi:MAG: type B DNA-directed DNA polymerase [Methanomicrobiales archaeon]
MWILDAVTRGREVEVWGQDAGGRVARERYDVPGDFLVHAPRSWAAHSLEAMIDDLPAEPCRFDTVHGPRDGYRVHAGRDVAVGIERQTGYAVELYNVDIRYDQRVFAGRGLAPCTPPGGSRWEFQGDPPITVCTVAVEDDPVRDREISAATVTADGECTRFSGDEMEVIADLAACLISHDPDVILFPHGDRWVPRIAAASRDGGSDPGLSRTGTFRPFAEKSYWSYGRTVYRSGALIPEGRVLIDTARSFMYREGGLSGIFCASRLSGIPPNYSSRFTPGTLISGYECYEALRRGLAVPFRKSDPEPPRRQRRVRAADRGGMIFTPEPGRTGRVHQIDYTSLYPAIIVRDNLSPETLGDRGRQGFLPAVLSPLLDLRHRTKAQKKQDPRFAGMDSALKWMLVTCFGYTGYRNAKFGSIRVHEQITGSARDILVLTKEIAERLGFEVLHGIVDCIWFRGDPAGTVAAAVEEEVGIPVETETYDWLVFLPQADGSGAYNRYFGKLEDGGVKMRGIAARRHDTPPYIRRMQEDLLEVMAAARNPASLDRLEPRVRAVYDRYLDGLAVADPEELAIRRHINRCRYRRRCLEGSAVEVYRREGIDPAPGMALEYVVRDAGRGAVDPIWNAELVDQSYYAGLLRNAWTEIAFAFSGEKKE